MTINSKKPAHNTGLAKVAFYCSASTFVVKIATFAKPETLPDEHAKTMINKEVIVKPNVVRSRIFDKEGNKTFPINLDKRYP